MKKLKPAKKIKSTLKISACYIVKNEEKNLSRSIESLKSAVDEIVVVDTGSTDKTIEIAKSYGAKVIETPWNDDFSTPRNLAIDNADGDWIIFIDADEYFVKPKKVRPTIEKLSNSTDAIFILRIDIDEDNDNREINRDYYLRALRNVDYLRYRGLIHENIENINGGGFPYEMANEELTLYHTGYSETKAESKLNRNLAIIQKEIKKDGLQFRHHIALVDCYFALDDYEKAYHHAKEIFKTDSRPVTGLAILYRKTTTIMRNLNRPVEEIITILNEAVKNFPKDTQFHLERGVLLSYLKQYDTARNDLQFVIKNTKNGSDFYNLAASTLSTMVN